MRNKYSFDAVSVKEISALIDDCNMDARNKSILRDRFINFMTFEELADKYSICERHVKRIVYKYGDKLLLKIK